jgi:DNA-binding NtrC family response regulator
MPDRVLVVEDESTLCANMARALGRAGFTVTAVESGKAALDELDEHAFDVVVTDLRLPDIDGFAVLDRARASSPGAAVLLMTAYASVDSAVEAMRRGAHDYVLKPLSLAELVRKVQRIAETQRLGRENARLRTLVKGEGEAIALLRNCGREMNALADVVDKVAASSSNVLVVGDSGVGKEVVARAIHERSPRAGGPWVTLDVSAIPEGQIESTLFGHERGREGVFRAASGGTLLLDEVGELSPAAQAKLLRAVESKEILPVGADRALRVDTRIVAATHCDLGKLVAEGRFREDLYYRLQVVTLRVPPLRERAGDVPRLAEHFLQLHARAQRKSVRAIDPEAMELLTSYPWPGNVRELSNVIERAVILASSDVLGRLDLPAELRPDEPRPSSPRAAAADGVDDLEEAVVAFQRDHIARVLDRVSGSRDAAARALGLSPATFYRYLQRLGLKGYRLDAGARREGEEHR